MPVRPSYGFPVVRSAPISAGLANSLRNILANREFKPKTRAPRSVPAAVPGATTPAAVPGATTPAAVPGATTPAAVPGATTPAAAPGATTPAANKAE
jgi:hypothetical protein